MLEASGFDYVHLQSCAGRLRKWTLSHRTNDRYNRGSSSKTNSLNVHVGVSYRGTTLLCSNQAKAQAKCCHCRYFVVRDALLILRWRASRRRNRQSRYSCRSVHNHNYRSFGFHYPQRSGVPHGHSLKPCDIFKLHSTMKCAAAH